MLKANLDVEGGFCNGSRGVVKEIGDEYVNVQFIKGTKQIGLFQFEYEDSNMKIIRNQIPLVLAWAMTIHKCLPGSALISTNKGMYKISDFFTHLEKSKSDAFYEPDEGLSSEVKVLTQLIPQPIHKLYKGVKLSTFRITTKFGYEIETSADHRLLIQKKKSLDYKWCKMNEISCGDKLYIKINKTNFDFKKKVVMGVEIDEDIGWMLGCLWPVTRYKGDITMFTPRNSKNLSIKFRCTKLMNILKKRFDIEPTITKYGILVNDKQFSLFLDNCGINNGSFPSSILQSPTNVQKMFIVGTYEGDVGWDGFKTSNREVMKVWLNFLLMCGFVSRYWKQDGVFHSEMLNETYSNTNDYFLDEIIFKDFNFKQKQMYDFEILPFNNFIANGIVNHNSQSCTMDCIEGDLGPSVFADGQAYVLCSRVRTRKGLYLTNFWEKSIKTSQEALNFLIKNQ